TTANLTGTSTTRTFTSLDKGAGTNWRETRTNATFDDYGRVTVTENLGDVAVPADDQCTRTTFADNTGAWILTGTLRKETVAVNCSAAVDRTTQADGTSAVLSDTRFRYDGQAYGAAPTKGDITLTETLKSTSGNNATYLDNVVTYDLYGRGLTATTLASSTVFDLTGTNTPATTALPNPRTTTTVYTPATGRPTKTVVTGPPATVGNAATAQSTTTDYDLLRGLATDTVDANNRRTDITYDALGRTLQVWLPDRSKTNGQTPDQEYAYNLADGQITSVATKSLNEDGSQQTSYTLYDGFGRVRQTQAPGTNGGRILTDTFYDERGQNNLAYAAYYATGAPSGTLRKVDDTTGVETQALQEFDGLGRVVKSTALAGNGVGTPLSTTLTEYGGDRVTVTPPTGATPTTTITDALGRTTELRQYKSATPTGAYDATTYGYDPAGNLTKLSGPSGTVWTWLYDQLGRQVKAVDPDTGTTLNAYNDRGELTSSTDGRGKTIASVYDNLSRLTETRDGSATGPLLTSQVWDPANNKGTLSSSSRFSTVGSTTYEYKTTYAFFDTLGRPTRTTVSVPSVPGQEALAGSYLTVTTYRLDGQVGSLSYPAAGNLAGESVTFTYDNLHQLTAVGNPLTSQTYQTGQTYSLTGKPLQGTFSNGAANKQVYLTDTYEWGTQRLASSRTDQYGIATPVRAAAYTYDQAGNVTSLTDTSSSGTDRQCYQYDYLARLTQAYTPNTGSCTAPSATQLGGPAPYWTSWTYNTNGTRATETRHNTAGNTAQDATTTYTYPADRPHALASTSTVTGALGTPAMESYSYDSAGNTTTRNLKPSDNQTSDQTLTWNTEGRLAQLAATVKTTTGSTTTTTNQITDYLYDASGNRLIGHTLDTSAPAAENWTLYLGNTELKLTKGATKATATRYYALSGATAVRTDDNRVTFQTSDHHGTAETNIDATTGAVNQRRTLPFGATRGTAPTSWAGTRGFLGGTDEPTGLTHLGARDYDTVTGRFTSADPLLVSADPQSFAAYTYSDNNPLTRSDPTGTFSAAQTDGGPAPIEKTAEKDEGFWGGLWGKAVDTGKGLIKSQVQITKQMTGCTILWNSQSCKDWAKGTAERIIMTPTGSALAGNMVMSTIDEGEEIYTDYTEGRPGQASGKATFLLLQFLPGGRGASAARAESAGASRGLSTISGLSFYDRLSQMLKGCKANSFPAGTLVLLADGTTRAIEQLTNGDLVLATDPTSGNTQAEPVDATIVTLDDSEFTELTVSGESGTETLTSTAHHPFWDATDNHWTNAQDIPTGHQLLGSNGEKYTVSASITKHTTPSTAYNLTIQTLHTYYVLAGETPVLVHNSNQPLPEVGPGASLDNLTLSEIRRIQNAANRIGQSISVVGSRAAGTPGPNSDWDYVITGINSRVKHSVSSSLPKSDITVGLGRQQDIFTGPLVDTEPHITFHPAC
ncbi:polymorphic toxin-type HINT domain-containing protein, partial [Kitasatospora phosalacinea]|uniref:polymorphic toxin-type HINT domain-containing protein n=1 Tax=Kitasatospora phosalacinea TaxID=2065 RepID=UPI00365511B8